jgi:flavin-dependent dehydrogenase
MSTARSCDVAVIGAGPAGAVAAALLSRQGYEVEVLERQSFPRFSIGESLLPQCMAFLNDAGMISAVERGGFQLKNGAAFERAGSYTSFDFSDRFSEGWSYTYQVQRARFDKILADEAAKAGAVVHYQCEIETAQFDGDSVRLKFKEADGRTRHIQSRFCLDASGFGKTLARLLGLEVFSSVPQRESIFTHVIDRMKGSDFDRNKILITVHPTYHCVWFWLIPFSDGTASLGVVGPCDFFSRYTGDELQDLQTIIAETGLLGDLMKGAEYHMPVRRISNYASQLSRLHGENFALIGNAGGFLDPVFSSGVTIALKSASLAVKTLDRQLKGESPDWENDYAVPLNVGVETFRHFVSAWYDSSLQDIIFARSPNSRIRQMICSILAGYAWDETNPYVAQPFRRLNALAEACRRQ